MSSQNLLKKIHHLSLQFLKPLTITQTYKTVVREGVSLVDGKDGSIFLKRGGSLHGIYTSSAAVLMKKVRQRGFTYKAYRTGKPLQATVTDFVEAHPELVAKGVQSLFFIPLVYKHESLGVLTVESYSNKKLPPKEIDFLKIFGDMASLAIRKAQLHNEVKKTLKTRDLFISMAAHELKTPLTALSGYIQLLDRKLTDTQTPEARWVDQLVVESNRLKELIDDFLQTDRIKGGELTYSWKECDLVAVLRNSINEFHFTHPDRLVLFDDRLKNAVNSIIISDVDKLMQVFDNLLGNAAKFSASDTPIAVTMSFKAPFFVITIEDKGKGISPDDLPFIFDEYYKVADKDQSEGMGLGLFLVKNIIEKHHGIIKIDSELQKGTIITLKLRRKLIANQSSIFNP